MKRNKSNNDTFWPPRPINTLMIVRKTMIFLSMNLVEKDSSHLLPRCMKSREKLVFVENGLKKWEMLRRATFFWHFWAVEISNSWKNYMCFQLKCLLQAANCRIKAYLEQMKHPIDGRVWISKFVKNNSSFWHYCLPNFWCKKQNLWVFNLRMHHH